MSLLYSYLNGLSLGRYVICLSLLFIFFIGGLQKGTAQDTLSTPSPERDTGQIIHLINADVLIGIQGNGSDSAQKQKLIGNVKLRQGQTIFTADSATRYMSSNVLDAFGHIHINQADSINTYADELHYEGNTKIATLFDNVRMTDGHMILTTDHLDYNMNTHVGTYYKGGKLVNQETILTSQNGYYYADTKDVYFKENVKLNNPKYKLTTDTLLYNTITHIATFKAPTAINTGNSIIYTSCGYYSTDRQFSFLCNRPIIIDSSGTLIADSLRFSKAKGVGRAYENIVWRDTSGQLTLQSDYAISNNNKKTLLATKDPLLILAQETDSLFVTSDTLFTGPFIPIKTKNDSLSKDSISYVYVPDSLKVKKDSLLLGSLNIDSVLMNNEEFQRLQHQLPIISNQLSTDSLRLPPPLDKAPLKERKPTKEKGKTKEEESKTKETSTAKKVLSLFKGENQDSSEQEDTTLSSVPKDTETDTTLNKKLGQDSTLQANDQKQKAVDSADARELIAYYHVRLYSDSLQGIADSLYYSNLDSTFRFYGDPVLWTGHTQLFGDTIILITKNQKPFKLILQQNAMIVNKVGPQQFNQIKGRVITGFFNDSSQLDWMQVEGNAESLYYAQEDSTGAVIGLNRTTSSFIRLYFEDNGLNQVKFYKNISGTFKNPAHLKEEDTKLKGFKWEEEKRPPRKPPLPRINNKKSIHVRKQHSETIQPEQQ